MEVIRAADTGFCFGVRRAVRMMQEAAESQTLVSLGTVVHNPRVVRELQEMGVAIIDTPAQAAGQRVAITAHGVGPDVRDELGRLGVQLIDTTCPTVVRSQRWAQKLSREGYTVLVFGDPQHKEVRGVVGWGGEQALAIPSIEALDSSYLETLGPKIALLAQTTETAEHFAAFANALRERLPSAEIRIVDTLCNATTRKQAAVRELASRVDLIIVVGGRESANTRHLADVARERVQTVQIESAAEINASLIAGHDRVGVAAGASTPDADIDDVVQRLTLLAAS